MAQEGQTAVGPNGERAVFTGGQWVVQAGAPSGPMTIGQPDPTMPYKVPKVAADIGNTQANTARTITTTGIDAAKAPGEIAKTTAEGSIAAGKLNTGAGVIGEAERSKALAQMGGARALGGSIADIQKLFEAGPGATKGLSGLWDYLPDGVSPSNQAFNTASNNVRGPVRNALGLTGGEANTVAEARMNLGGYVPNSGDFDSTIEQKIAGLKRLQNNATIDAIQKLGGIPDANGNVQPLTEQQRQIFAAYQASSGNTPEGHDGDLITALSGGNPPSGGGGGNTPPPGGNPPTGGPQLGLSRGESYTTPQDIAVAAAVNKAYQAGGDIKALVQAAKAAGGQITPQDLANFQAAIQARKGGQSATFNPQATGRRSPASVMAGNALMSPLGTAAATAVSGTGLNALDAFLPDQMQALRSLNPGSSAVGDIAGAIGGTHMLGKIAEGALTRTAPSLASRFMGGGAGGQFARNVLGDTAFGASYGNNVEGDAATGALGGALGSVGGQLAGKALGAGIGGAMRSPQGQYLSERIGDLTVGQQLGGTAKNLEDAAMSLPFIGDLVKKRRGESLIGLNKALSREASGIVGGNVDAAGAPAIDQLGTLRSQAYSDAIGGKSFTVDPQGMADYQQAQTLGAGLPDDLKAKFSLALKNRVEPVINNAQMSGDDYQQAMRGLSGYKAEATKPGFEQDYRGALTSAQDALRGIVSRSANPETLGQLGNADYLHRAIKVLEDAQGRARKDTTGLGGDIIRPGDLTDAVYQNGKKYGGTAPFQKIAEAAQNVIPSKMPDSGTAYRRALQALVGGSVLGGGAGGAYGALTGEDSTSGGLSGAGTGVGSSLAAMGLLAIGGSRMGQKALQKALIDRPDILVKAGAKVRKAQGLFGSASVPLLLESGQ